MVEATEEAVYNSMLKARTMTGFEGRAWIGCERSYGSTATEACYRRDQEPLHLSTQPKTLLSPEEYLEVERKAEFKSEYFRGQMFAMAGASREHNLISGNLFASIHGQIRGRPCQAYSGDMRVRVIVRGLYTYPDIAVVCGKARFIDDQLDTLLNPALIAEVLSPSTEAYDRGRKFEHYRQIESLREYLLISSDRVHVDLYTRHTDGRWLASEYSLREETVDLQSIGCRILLADLYEKVELEEPAR